MVTLNTTKGNLNVFNGIKAECDRRGIELITNHKANTGIYAKEKQLICDSVMGGIILLPVQLAQRMTFLQRALDDTSSLSRADDYLATQPELEDTACKLIVLPELSVLEITNNCCGHLVDWARGAKCLVLPKQDTPPALLQGMKATGDNFTILPIDSDESVLIKNATEVFCSTVSGAAIECIWLGKEFSYMKEGRPHDIGAFRLLNVMLASNVSTRQQRIRNFLSSTHSGLFLPGRDGPETLRTYLKYYEENYEKATHSHSA